METKIVSITIQKDDDGLNWLFFKDVFGREALINIENYFLDTKNSVINSCIRQWARDQF